MSISQLRIQQILDSFLDYKRKVGISFTHAVVCEFQQLLNYASERGEICEIFPAVVKGSDLTDSPSDVPDHPIHKAIKDLKILVEQKYAKDVTSSDDPGPQPEKDKINVLRRDVDILFKAMKSMGCADCKVYQRLDALEKKFSREAVLEACKNTCELYSKMKLDALNKKLEELNSWCRDNNQAVGERLNDHDHKVDELNKKFDELGNIYTHRSYCPEYHREMKDDILAEIKKRL